MALEDYSLEVMKRLWSEYIEAHELKGEVLDAAAGYPETQHLSLDYHDIAKFNVELAEYVLENPTASLMAAEMTIQEVQAPQGRVPIQVIVVDLPEDSVRRPVDLRVTDLGHLVAVRGMVGTTELPTARFKLAVFQCMRCGAIHRMEQNTPGKIKGPLECYKENNGCQRAAGSTKFRCLTSPAELPDPFQAALGDYELDFSEMTDEQWLDVQDSPESLKGNELPAVLRSRVEGPRLVRKVNPGDQVTLYGVLRVDDGKGTVSPEMYFDVNHLENHTREMLVVTDEDRIRLRAIVDMYPDPLSELLVPSLAPHVYGLSGPKHGIMCQLMGGLDGKVGSKVLRWMMHLLIVGDPGTGKSILLRHVSKLVPRGSYVDAGKASRAGLVAKAEQVKGRWVAVPGYVVKSSGSVCCVDELNKMSPEDIAMLNDSMESGVASLAKAGAGEFPAETAILAAMNPKEGSRYGGDFYAEVEIEGATLSRFALIYIITDEHTVDQGLQGLIRPYYTNEPAVEADGNGLLSMEDMRRFVAIARPLRPKLTAEAAAMVEEQHLNLRNAEESSWSNRVLEDLYRLSAAVAKSRLSETATVDDVSKAIEIHAMAAWGEIHGTGDKIQVDYIAPVKDQRSRHRILLEVIREMEDGDGGAELNLVITRARDRGVPSERIREDIERMLKDGQIYDKSHQNYRVV